MFSAILGLAYTVSKDEIIFEDGVKYTHSEGRVLKGVDNRSLQLVHEIKKLFGGEVRRTL